LRTLIPFAVLSVNAQTTGGFWALATAGRAVSPRPALLAEERAAARFLPMSSQPRIPSATQVADDCVTVSYVTVALGCRLPLARVLCCRMS
jgi:hypothetical protein